MIDSLAEPGKRVFSTGVTGLPLPWHCHISGCNYAHPVQSAPTFLRHHPRASPLPTPTLPFSVGKSPLLTKRWEGCGTNPALGHETNLLQIRSFAPAAYDATRCVGPVALGSQGRRVGQWQNLIGSVHSRGIRRQRLMDEILPITGSGARNTYDLVTFIYLGLHPS